MTGTELKTILEHYGMTQKEAAKKFNVAETTICRAIAKHRSQISKPLARKAIQFSIEMAKLDLAKSSDRLNSIFNQLYMLTTSLEKS